MFCTSIFHRCSVSSSLISHLFTVPPHSSSLQAHSTTASNWTYYSPGASFGTLLPHFIILVQSTTLTTIECKSRVTLAWSILMTANRCLTSVSCRNCWTTVRNCHPLSAKSDCHCSRSRNAIFWRTILSSSGSRQAASFDGAGRARHRRGSGRKAGTG